MPCMRGEAAAIEVIAARLIAARIGDVGVQGRAELVGDVEGAGDGLFRARVRVAGRVQAGVPEGGAEPGDAGGVAVGDGDAASRVEVLAAEADRLIVLGVAQAGGAERAREGGGPA